MITVYRYWLYAPYMPIAGEDGPVAETCDAHAGQGSL